MQPNDPSYELNDLIDDLYLEMNLKKYFANSETAIEEMQDSFYKGKKIAIDSFREGLNLGGKIPFTSILRNMSPEAVRASLFAKQKITSQDVIDLLHSDYERVKNKTRMDECKNFFDNTLKEHIRERAQLTGSKDFFCGDKFLREFLAFCTGSPYIPYYQQGYNIIVEFNCEEDGLDKKGSLPVTHTCEKILKLPIPIYKTKELFAQKLDIALVNSAGFFSMK